MAKKILKNSEEWFKLHKEGKGGAFDKIKAVKILDPDGWDRSNFEESWNELITQEEFDNRLLISTCLFERK